MIKEKNSDIRKRKYLATEEKYQIFIEVTIAKSTCNRGVRNILRRWSIDPSDLTRIKRTPEEGAISSFKSRKGQLMGKQRGD
jgi:hypothetical protein